MTQNDYQDDYHAPIADLFLTTIGITNRIKGKLKFKSIAIWTEAQKSQLELNAVIDKSYDHRIQTIPGRF